MPEKVIITDNTNSETLVVTEVVNKVVIPTAGVQGPAGRTILNGIGAPAANLGTEGDFYYDKDTTRFYGPKIQHVGWDNATNYLLNQQASTLTYPFSISQLQHVVPGVGTEYYSLEINHNLNYNPNVTVRNSAGDVLETGIDYNNNNKITLIMAQPFGGTAYLS